jgi:hypothetical protein
MVKASCLLVVPLLVSLIVAFGVSPVQASWRSSNLMGPNQGYCKDGRQHRDISKCNRNPHAAKSKKSGKHE